MYVSRMGQRLRFTSIAEFSGWDEDKQADDCIATLRHRAETLFPAATVGRDPQVWCGGRPLTPDDRPISCRAPGTPNVYVHSGGGAYGWRVSMGVSERLAMTIGEDGHSDGATPHGEAPSLDKAGPRTVFDTEILGVERFQQLLPLWPRSLFGW